MIISASQLLVVLHKLKKMVRLSLSMERNLSFACFNAARYVVFNVYVFIKHVNKNVLSIYLI